MMSNNLFPEVQAFARSLSLSKLPAERQNLLRKLSLYLNGRWQKGQQANIMFICTHNSRRSQFAQVWAHTAAFYYGIKYVRVFSGGTERTAFHPHAVRALESAGFRISKKENGANPTYTVLCGPEAEPLTCFSKKYNDPLHSPVTFAAVLVCSDAEENCPFIPEADARLAIRYDDPKIADDTPLEAQTYADRSRQIATEMFYVFSRLQP